MCTCGRRARQHGNNRLTETSKQAGGHTVTRQIGVGWLEWLEGGSSMGGINRRWHAHVYAPPPPHIHLVFSYTATLEIWS